MTWQEIYPILKNKQDKQTCYEFALECSKQGIRYSKLPYYLSDILKHIEEDNKDWLKEHFYTLKLLRVKEPELAAKESTHILIHMIEVLRANNSVSAAGHAARCGEALSRIDNDFVKQLVSRYE